MKRILTFFSILFITICTGCSNARLEPITVSDFLFNTYVSITIYDKDKVNVISEALELCRHYELIFSRTLPESSLYELNASQHIANADPELFELIETGLFYCELTNGSLDISIEPLTSLWNITSANPSVPEPADIQAALACVDYKNIILNKEDLSITLTNNTGIDLGAIAKGYIADKLKQFLIANGVTNGTIDLGGNILCIGSKPDGSDYTIAIKEPVADSSAVILALQINDMSVVTSGTYERFFVENDITYHHILDSSTGYPSDSDLVSVTIISEESVVGDCLSTACLVMGIDKSLELVNSLDNVYCILIDHNMSIYYSNGAKDLLR